MHIPKIRGRALVVGAALAVTTALASACSGGSPGTGRAAAPSPRETAATSEPTPWVLFQQEAGARQEVAIIRTDGTDRTAPLHDLAGGHQSNPDWSPDGRRFVFAMSDGTRDDLWVADADGGHARLLLDCQGSCRWLDDPDWSPDGNRIVYSRSRVEGGAAIGTLETVDVRTGLPTVLLDMDRREFTAGARWSPDGRRIVFELVHTVGPGLDADIDAVALRLVRLTGVAGLPTQSPARTLTDPRLFAATADWSPDGTRIVYSALAKPNSSAEDLFWIRPGGGVPTQLTHVVDDGGYAREPAWLPDGTGVLFSGHLDEGAGSPELLSVRLDGGGLGAAFGADTLFGRHPRVQPAS